MPFIKDLLTFTSLPPTHTGVLSQPPSYIDSPHFPSTRPNTKPSFSVFTELPPSQRPVSTLVPHIWQRLLAGYPDPRFVQNIVGIATHGARIGYEGPPLCLNSSNHSSALEIPTGITSNIADELRLGRIGEITDFPSHFACSPLGAVPKKQNGEFIGWRRIHDLSFPHGSSVNDGIPEHYRSLEYQTLDDAIDIIARLGRYTALHKRDLKDAFRKIPVSPLDYHLLFFQWDGITYEDKCLPFGLATSPLLFNLFAEALHWILNHRYAQEVVHYLDDFLLISGDDPALFSTLCTLLGVEVKTSKSLDGCVVDFLGIELDSDKMEARLPKDKHVRAIKTVLSALAAGKSTYKDLESLVGFLSFCARVVPLGRPFLRNLFNLLQVLAARSPSRSTVSHKLSPEALTDLRWWATLLKNWSGVRIIKPLRTHHTIHTDASGTKGIGGWFQKLAFATSLPRRHAHKHINWKEAYAILYALAKWSSLLRGTRVLFMCDNQAIVDALSNRTIRGEAISVLQFIFLAAAVDDIELSACWLPSEENWIADALSRFKFDEIADLDLQVSTNEPEDPVHLLRQRLATFFPTDLPNLHAQPMPPLGPSINSTHSSTDTQPSQPNSKC